jgi:hypothetical protein
MCFILDFVSSLYSVCQDFVFSFSRFKSACVTVFFHFSVLLSPSLLLLSSYVYYVFLIFDFFVHPFSTPLVCSSLLVLCFETALVSVRFRIQHFTSTRFRIQVLPLPKELTSTYIIILFVFSPVWF